MTGVSWESRQKRFRRFTRERIREYLDVERTLDFLESVPSGCGGTAHPTGGIIPARDRPASSFA
jgi:hypothetical protein